MSNIFDELSQEIVDFSDDVFTEAVTSDSIPLLRMVTKQVLLPVGKPVGKSNLCFLYSHSLEESISLMNSTVNFLNKNHYKYYYYNYFYQGKIYNKKYRINELQERKEIYKQVESQVSNMKGRIRLTNTSQDNKNMYYELYRFLSIFESICSNLQPLRYISYYWSYMGQVLGINLSGYTNKFVIVDLSRYHLSKKLNENLKNPLFLIYYTLLRKPELLKSINLDFYFYVNRKVFRVNPSLLNADNSKDLHQLRAEMKKIMHGVSNETEIDTATSDDTIKKEELTSNISSSISKVIQKPEEDKVFSSSEELVKFAKTSTIEKHVSDKVEKEVEKIKDINKVSASDKEDIDSNVRKEINSDKDLIHQIYYQNKRDEKISKSSASTARDEMLREAQKDLKVGDLTISDLSKVNGTDIPISSHDVSRAVTTTNENMKDIQFANFNKDYINKVMKKDITNAILSLNDKSIPMYVRNIEVKDTSNELNYKDTYTIQLEDANRKRHTIKVDIPKFLDDHFLYLGGNKKIIKNQDFYYPIVKISPTIVLIVTNYSKMTIERVENKFSGSVERMLKLVSSNDSVRSYFTVGNVYSKNRPFITTLEYDYYSKSFSNFKYGKTNIIFDQSVCEEYLSKNQITKPKNTIYIGKEKGKDIFIDINTQRTKDNRTITDIIIENLPDEDRKQFLSIRSPKKLMFAKVKIMKQFVTVGMLLGLWVGLSDLLKRMNVEFSLEDKVPSQLSPGQEYLKFKDCVLVYKETIPNSLILNGFRSFDTANYNLVEFDEKTPYLDYIKKVYGKVIIENALMNFYEFAVDPISKEILETLHQPTNIVDIFLYACELLSDSQYTLEISQNLNRVRNAEVIPAILYERISKNYVEYRNSAGKKKFNIPQDCVIKELLGLKTVEDYSTLNPFSELQALHGLSTKGFRGVNLDDSYTLERRGYDPSMVGVISPTTSPDGNCGISKYLTTEPKITNLRGFTEDHYNDLDSLKDVNVYSPSELTVPFSCEFDDPNRLGHCQKQASHVLPVKDNCPVLVSNGMEEAARFHLTSNFVVNADEDGEVIDYDEESHVIVVRYKSGKCKAVDLSPNIVKNGGGGFFLSNILKSDLKVGDKFKKDTVLAYHKDFFKNDSFNNCRLNVGTLTKVAIMSTYNTYEDATFITHSLSERCASEMCFCKPTVVGKNSNVFYMVKKGQQVSVGDTLIQFDTSFDDESINTLLANLSSDEQNSIMEEARNEVKSKYSGTIEDIKIYSTVDLDELSPSLRKIVSSYYREINHKKEFLEKYDPESKDSIVKCGVLLNETSKKVEPNKFGVIKGEKVEDSVLIEFYIKHEEPLEVGSKIAKHKMVMKNLLKC